ncbi:MAG: PfkB family carbohydrate kinase [Candidatus Eremiobacteraeota bacterium]|nr:PfkB family carbohydrate kinase [Candidatus Eremiobacteraeota bacterium]
MMLIERERARELIFNFREISMLVLGDSMLDQWIWGKVNRISPEAPVPVVEVDYYSYSPGGAANVVNNLCSLGARSSIVSIIGEDEYGVRLRQELSGRGVDVTGLVTDPSRPTTTKSRIIANHQQVCRTDIEKRDRINGGMTEKLGAHLEESLEKHKLVVISDYNKGLLNDGLVGRIMQWKARTGGKVVVGPKPENIGIFKGATLIALNEKEAVSVAGEKINDQESLGRVGQTILSEFKNEAVLITRGEKGMALFTDKGETASVSALASEVFDVSGAGDTVLSVVALSLRAGASFREAMILSNFAAAVVVKKVGTATVSISELIDVIDKQHLSTAF